MTNTMLEKKKKAHILPSLSMCICDPCLLICSIISIRLIASCGIDEAKAYTFKKIKDIAKSLSKF